MKKILVIGWKDFTLILRDHLLVDESTLGAHTDPPVVVPDANDEITAVRLAELAIALAPVTGGALAVLILPGDLEAASAGSGLGNLGGVGAVLAHDIPTVVPLPDRLELVFGGVDVGVSLTVARDLNRYYEIGNDVTNVNLQLAILWKKW